MDGVECSAESTSVAVRVRRPPPVRRVTSYGALSGRAWCARGVSGRDKTQLPPTPVRVRSSWRRCCVNHPSMSRCHGSLKTPRSWIRVVTADAARCWRRTIFTTRSNTDTPPLSGAGGALASRGRWCHVSQQVLVAERAALVRGGVAAWCTSRTHDIHPARPLHSGLMEVVPVACAIHFAAPPVMQDDVLDHSHQLPKSRTWGANGARLAPILRAVLGARLAPILRAVLPFEFFSRTAAHASATALRLHDHRLALPLSTVPRAHPRDGASGAPAHSHVQQVGNRLPWPRQGRVCLGRVRAEWCSCCVRVSRPP